jgi:integrase
MRYAMPNPELINGNYYLRVHVPKDVAIIAKGKTLQVPVGDHLCPATVGSVVKVSLRTKVYDEAKKRFTIALAAIERQWEAFRKGPTSIPHKTLVALTGEFYREIVSIVDEEPGETTVWEAVKGLHDRLDANLEARRNWYSGRADALLAAHGLNADEASKLRLIEELHSAAKQWAAVTYRKAQGDYRPDPDAGRFPELPQQPTKTQSVQPAEPTPHRKDRITLAEVVAAKAERRSLGNEAKPLPKKSTNKFMQVAKEFAAYRGSADATNITPQEVDAWMVSMLREGNLSNNTIAQRIGNLGTIIEWARKASFGSLYPMGNPAHMVTPPEAQGVRSEDRTLRIPEAKAILLASRRETKPELRWCPWLLAYSGARIGELSQLKRDDFFQLGVNWFYRITTKGKKTVKVEQSIRRVPIHPDVLAEGFVTYLQSLGSDERLFPVRTVQNLHDWVRNDLKLDRPDLAPNHGWRHLFEDLALLAGMNESAKRYITGRTTGHSSEGYGKSDAMLPGLAAEMRKLPSVLSLSLEDTV